jgi:hypothetical protein
MTATALLVLSMLAAAPADDDLVGLWKARRRFGPDGRGTLVIRRTGPAYTADMMGRILPVRVEQGELSFDLPGGQGTFRGRPQAGGILGYWVPSEPKAMGGHATPVRLTPDGPNRWKGEVAPFDDVFTFHLVVRNGPTARWALSCATSSATGAPRSARSGSPATERS